MALFRVALGIISSFLIFPLQGKESNRVLYLIQAGQLSPALDLYTQLSEENPDHELLQKIALILLDLGWGCRDPEIQTLSLFGAGIAANEHTYHILEEAIKQGAPQHQLIALHFLSRYQTDEGSALIEKAASSATLPIRLEAVFRLAEMQHPRATSYIESLMQKAPREAHALFPRLFAMSGDRAGIARLKKLLSHPSLPVRIEAILNAAAFHRDDLLPEIRMLAAHHQAEEQEAASLALGILKDEGSVERLQTLTNSKIPTVKLAACRALYQLGREEYREEIIKEASQGNLFAITLLGEIPGTESALEHLAKKDDLNIRVNASLALLERRDPRCMAGLLPVLIKDPRDLAWSQVSSLGKGLTAWKAIPSAKQHFKNLPLAYELSLHFREQTLQKTVNLPELSFLALAQTLFETGQNDLIRPLSHLLENLHTQPAIDLLKHYREKPGSPLIRCWCNLALYRMQEEGSYADYLKQWVSHFQTQSLIQFRPLLPWKMRDQEPLPYQLTPEDTSRLLVESFESLVQTQDSKSIELLLNAIKNGNRKNRYALAGLLIRASD